MRSTVAELHESCYHESIVQKTGNWGSPHDSMTAIYNVDSTQGGARLVYAVIGEKRHRAVITVNSM